MPCLSSETMYESLVHGNPLSHFQAGLLTLLLFRRPSHIQAVAHKIEKVPSHYYCRGQDYSGGPVPDSHRVPFSSTEVEPENLTDDYTTRTEVSILF